MRIVNDASLMIRDDLFQYSYKLFVSRRVHIFARHKFARENNFGVANAWRTCLYALESALSTLSSRIQFSLKDRNHLKLCVRACVRACVCVYVCARACVRACVRAPFSTARQRDRRNEIHNERDQMPGAARRETVIGDSRRAIGACVIAIGRSLRARVSLQ
jgi:hypothetical protein